VKRILTIVGTRPEIIKLCRVIHELEESSDHILVHTGQNYDYELNEIFFNDLGIRKPDYFLEAADITPSSSIANIIKRSDALFEELCPDAVLVYGDTNSCLAVISAKRRKIPIFHMEAGNRCFDQRVPEEINRKIVDHLSDINMTLTEHARRYLISEGIRPETVIKVGSSMGEVLNYYSQKIDVSQVLNKLELETNNYFLVSAHREENIDSDQNFSDLLETLNSIANVYNKRVIVSTHPRTRKKLEFLKKYEFNSLIEFLPPLGFTDYISLQKNAYCTLSDSGTITEEASLLSIPAVMIRQAHERPEGMDAGVLIMAGLKNNDILSAIDISVKHNRSDNIASISDYNDKNISKKVVKIIYSYIDYVNRNVWKK